MSNSSSDSASNKRIDAGQSTVEFALIVPVVVLLGLVLVQVAVVASARLGVERLGRDLARTVVLDPSIDIDALIETTIEGRPKGLRIEIQFVSSPRLGTNCVQVRVWHRPGAVSGLLQPFLDDFVVHSTVKMVMET